MSENVSSYNAGYHRGLNTEYHDVPVKELFAEWLADVRRPAEPDLVSFTEGYEEGLLDYAAWKNNAEILHDRPHKEVGVARAARVARTKRIK